MEVKSFYGNIQKFYTLFSSNPNRWKILQNPSSISLHRLSDTCWSTRIEAVKPLVKKPREIVQALDTLNEGVDLPVDLCNEVNSLVKWPQSFEYHIASNRGLP